MPVFDTPEPVLVTVELAVGTVRIAAGERTDTSVDVRPADPDDVRDVVTATAADIAFEEGELLVSVPTSAGPRRGGGNVIVEIAVPAGSQVQGEALAADFHGEGRLGKCRISTGCGHVHFAETGPFHVSSMLGNLKAERVRGELNAVVECGDVEIGKADGPVRLSRTCGDTRVRHAVHDVRVVAKSGDVLVGRAHAGVEARTGQGDIRVQEAVRGPVVLCAAVGSVDVGVTPGADASLDLGSQAGTVFRSLELLGGAAEFTPGTRTVDVRARTGTGDIVVRRATPSA